MLKTISFIVLAYAGLISLANAQTFNEQHYLYRIWSVESGLPQISVTAIAEDAQGFIWLGTQNGLARFDGFQFTVFNSSNTDGLSSGLITALHVDRQQRLWVGTVNGVFVRENERFSRYDAAAPLSGPVSAFAELSDGTILIGAGKLYLWRNGAFADSPHQKAVFQLHQQADKVWIGSEHGFAVWHLDTYQWFAAPRELAPLQFSNIAVVNNSVYLGTHLGLFHFLDDHWQQLPLPEQDNNSRIDMLYKDPQQQLWVATYTKTYQLVNGELISADKVLNKDGDFIWIQTMLQDQRNNIWLGSRAHGLKRVRQVPTQRFSVAEGLQEPYTWAVEPWRGQLLVGTGNGMALLKDGRFSLLNANAYLPNKFVYSFYQDQHKRVWVGTRNGLAQLDADTLQWQRNIAIDSPMLITSLVAEANRLWVGAQGGLFYLDNDRLQQDDVPDMLRKAMVRSILPDSAGRLWVGTESGLYWRTAEGFLKSVDNPLSDSFITVIKQFADGNIFIGSLDHGFMLGQPGQWRYFNQASGLPGNNMMHVEQFNDSLVISSLQGFYRISYSALLQGELQQLYMLVDDRRPGAATDSHRCCNGAGSSKGAVSQNRLFFPTLDGVVSLPLTQLYYHTLVPQPVIESLTTGGQRLHGSQLALSAEQRNWHVQFTAPEFGQPATLALRYQLKGFDQDWVDAAGRREAFYTNLPPGQYRFSLQVRAAADYRWSEPVTMDISLQPYWHETLWARTLLLLWLLAMLWLIFRWRWAKLAQQQLMLEQLVAQRTNELKQANQQLQQLSMQDALTGVFNRHYLDANIDQILSRVARSGEALTMALLDADHFKSINDKLGHQVGDKVLQQLAQLIRQKSRNTDHLIRWGGEEFLLILEDSADAPQVLQRLLQAIRDSSWQQSGLPQPLTCSIGAVCFTADANWQHQLQWADQALYWIKAHGRDGYLLLPESQMLPENSDLPELLLSGAVKFYSDKSVTV
ncbi:ligand-binding sensor domain-containing diguanylate cyclase [Arsukibacterium sp.]|uniref:ligand-binding sensor domain-containing diguanylate cyclase n=1 Tax=Arsukibacterium sp. TaxID=1977258 RepID=UPI002FD929DF